MDVFRRNYNTYYLILRFTGLWPFDDSILPKIQRTFFSVFTLCCILIQVSTLQHVEITFNNILTTLSYACPMLLYFLRYLGFAANFALVKSFLQDLQNDCAEIQNPAEAKILKKHMEKTRRIFLLFLCLSILGITFVSARVVIPAILRSKYQLYTLRSFGFFYTEQSRHADWACVHLSLTTAIGMLTIACTEGTLAVFSLYLCGLFEIVGYRMRGTIDNAAQLGTSKQIDIGPAIVMHQRAFNGQQLANTSNYVFNETYNSMWYTIPSKSQKLLLFVLMKSATEVQFNLAGLFVPCYEGFTMMMSSSFSYFTVLYSV
ncbi:uncharacterized protein LOC143353089 isoform X3 [Halictus rubicundus]|uniref:uncharacterized protein LOC143353089 isoform X3 n=1 Tax=Halictus rubicundus TaxID=77578 RepID=UPI0040372E45